MPKTTYGKLVRDGVPAYLEARGVRFGTHTASDDEEYSRLLDAKLREEADELLRAATKEEQTEEIVDLRTVMGAVMRFAQYDDETMRPAFREHVSRRVTVYELRPLVEALINAPDAELGARAFVRLGAFTHDLARSLGIKEHAIAQALAKKRGAKGDLFNRVVLDWTDE